MKIKSAILFLNNMYHAKDNEFYLGLIGEMKYSIAVDGGIRFFLKNKIKPDLLIGDFDSTPRMTRKFLSSIEVIEYPQAKNKTDSHLALEIAMDRGAKKIKICGALSGRGGRSEIDHALGNIFLLDLVNRYNKKHAKKIDAALVGSSETVWVLSNSSRKIVGRPGDYLSVIPLSDQVRMKSKGLVYSQPKQLLKFGDSLTLRNRLRSKSCKIEISGGRAVIVLSRVSQD